MMSIIITPTTAALVSAIRLAGIRHTLAHEVMQDMCLHGNAPVSLWKFINFLTEDRQLDSRAGRRFWQWIQRGWGWLDNEPIGP